MHPLLSFLLSLLFLPAALSHSLTLTVPQSTPNLPPSTHAQLTTFGKIHKALLTTRNTFVFRNLTAPGEYNLDIYCRDFDFEPGTVVVPAEDEKGKEIDVFRRNFRTGGKMGRLGKNGVNGGWEVRVAGRREYYEARSGCEFASAQSFSLFSLSAAVDLTNSKPPPVDPLSMLKSPMILMALVGLAVVFGMPYLLENMDPEMRKEFEEQQKKSVLGNAAAGGGNPLQSFDMAGWMAGQASGEKTAAETGAVASGRDREEGGGGGGGKGGGGHGKGRRRG
ncbi:MAG: hypothetical protein Q9219_000624 [cf. Caloplaca sp. 3 TL-2023]